MSTKHTLLRILVWFSIKLRKFSVAEKLRKIEMQHEQRTFSKFNDAVQFFIMIFIRSTFTIKNSTYAKSCI